MATTRSLILGGGFGGIAVANTLRPLVPVEHEIAVVDPSPRFHVGAGKTWIMLGERTRDTISADRASLLAPGVRLIASKVESLDLPRRTAVAGGAAFPWDFLVIALGADVSLSKVPGLAEAAHTFYTIEGAERLHAELQKFPGGEIALVIPRLPFKCPPAPYEAAMLLHAFFERRGIRKSTHLSIHTVEGAPMGTAGPEMGRYIAGELASRSIGYFPGRKLARVEPDQRRAVFEDGSDAHYDLLIAVPPHEAPEVVRAANLTNASGFILVDPRTLAVTAETGGAAVYAVGDVTSVPLPGRYKPEVALSLPKAGVFAEAQGRVVARRIAATILGREAVETFDGKGYCFLETGGGRAMKAEGSFFDIPHPVMQKRADDETQMREKLDWVERLLHPPQR